MVNLEENMRNIKNDEARVTVGDSITITRKNVAIVTDTRDVTENSIA